MANRFIDTSFFKSPFVRGLKGSSKSLYCFIICESSGAGIWVKELKIASEYIGFEISEKEFQQNFIETGKAIDLKNGKYFFPDFIEHQYPKGLSDNNIAHKNFILELKKYGLIDESLKVLKRPFEGSKVMVMVKEEVKEMVKVKEKTELFFPFDSENFISIWEILIKEKKWKSKSHAALQASLKILSEHNEQQAIKMMEAAIAGGWQGIHELKNNGNDTSKPKKYARITETEISNFVNQRSSPGSE